MGRFRAEIRGGGGGTAIEMVEEPSRQRKGEIKGKIKLGDDRHVGSSMNRQHVRAVGASGMNGQHFYM